MSTGNVPPVLCSADSRCSLIWMGHSCPRCGCVRQELRQIFTFSCHLCNLTKGSRKIHTGMQTHTHTLHTLRRGTCSASFAGEIARGCLEARIGNPEREQRKKAFSEFSSNFIPWREAPRQPLGGFLPPIKCIVRQGGADEQMPIILIIVSCKTHQALNVKPSPTAAAAASGPE